MVIGRIAAENPDLIRSVVRQALERVLGDRITVSLSPEDYRSLVAGEHEFKDVIDRTKRLMFREDETVAKGGCVVETEVGTIDARIETQLEAIRKALEELTQALHGISEKIYAHAQEKAQAEQGETPPPGGGASDEAAGPTVDAEFHDAGQA